MAPDERDSARDVRAADLKQTARAQRAPAPAASCVQQAGETPLVEGVTLRHIGVSPDLTKTAATNEHRSERSEQSNTAPVRRARCARSEARASDARRRRSSDARSDAITAATASRRRSNRPAETERDTLFVSRRVTNESAPQRPLRERSLNKWVKLRSSMS